MRLCVSTILSTAPMHETLHLGRAAQNQYTLQSNQGQVNSVQAPEIDSKTKACPFSQ